MRSFIKVLSHETGEEEIDLDLNDLSTGNIASSREWVEAGLGFDISELSHDQIDVLRPYAYSHISRQLCEPGYHKTHDAYTHASTGEPLFPLEATAGVLYIVRNPLDVAVSFAGHMNCTFDESIASMSKQDFAFCGKPFGIANQLRQRLLDWSAHVESWLDSGLPIQVVRYEEMRQKPLETFTAVAKYLGLPCDQVAISNAIALCDFDRLKEKEKQTGFREKPAKAKAFFRKGIVGDWRSSLTADQAKAVLSDHGRVMERLGYTAEL
jgi:hypothetical protein